VCQGKEKGMLTCRQRGTGTRHEGNAIFLLYKFSLVSVSVLVSLVLCPF